MIDRRDVTRRYGGPRTQGVSGLFREVQQICAVVRGFLERFSNLYPIGRNGMHRYNNQDHSMLAANGAVTAMINSGEGKSAIWQINADEEYHEEIKNVA
jgi:hypothetical protein